MTTTHDRYQAPSKKKIRSKNAVRHQFELLHVASINNHQYNPVRLSNDLIVRPESEPNIAQPLQRNSPADPGLNTRTAGVQLSSAVVGQDAAGQSRLARCNEALPLSTRQRQRFCLDLGLLPGTYPCDREVVSSSGKTQSKAHLYNLSAIPWPRSSHTWW